MINLAFALILIHPTHPPHTRHYHHHYHHHHQHYHHHQHHVPSTTEVQNDDIHRAIADVKRPPGGENATHRTLMVVT